MGWESCSGCDSLPLWPSLILVHAEFSAWSIGLENICQLRCRNERDALRVIWVTQERTEARNGDRSAFSVNIVTDVLGQGTPELVEDDESILFRGLLFFVDRCFLLLTQVAAHFPDVVAQFN